VTDTTAGTALAVRRPEPTGSPDARLFDEAMGRLADAHVTGARHYAQMLAGAANGGPGAHERAVRRAATEIVTLAHTLRDLQAIAGIRHLAEGLRVPGLDAEAFLAGLFAGPADAPAEAPTVPLPPARPGGVDPAEVEVAAARARRVTGLDEGAGR
jgi:hypothetical protein